MAKLKKDVMIYSRVDNEFKAKTLEYVSAAETDMSDLIRTAVEEYMISHPVELTDKEDV